MTKYEKLVIKAENENIKVLEIDLGLSKKCGKYFSTNNGNFIVINSILTDCQKYEILSEELGHHHTSSGNIINQGIINNAKQEKRARNWGYEETVGIVQLINAFEKGIREKHELADYLNVTEEFLEQAIQHYREKYETYCEIDNYLVYFEPNLTILKMI